MRRYGRAAVSIPVAVAIALWLVGIPGGSQPKEALAATTEAKAVAPPKGKPTFTATFPRGSKLNTGKWATCYPGANPNVGCTNFGNRQEAQWYVRGQVQVYGGVLHLVAQRKATQGRNASGGKKEYNCRSGMITSYPSLKLKYGFIQIVANIPHAPGLWPALWLGAANLQYPPEMDLVEGLRLYTAVYLHPKPASAFVRSRDRAVIPISWTTKWQTYSLRWTYSRLTFYVGSKAVLTITKNVPHQAMYFVADLAENLPPTKGRCNGQLQIRSVKYWKKAA